MRARARRRAARVLWARKREVIRAGRITSKPEHRYGLDPGTWLLWHGSDPAHCVCNGTHLAMWCPRCPDTPYPGDHA